MGLCADVQSLTLYLHPYRDTAREFYETFGPTSLDVSAPVDIIFQFRSNADAPVRLKAGSYPGRILGTNANLFFENATGAASYDMKSTGVYVMSGAQSTRHIDAYYDTDDAPYGIKPFTLSIFPVSIDNPTYSYPTDSISLEFFTDGAMIPIPELYTVMNGRYYIIEELMYALSHAYDMKYRTTLEQLIDKIKKRTRKSALPIIRNPLILTLPQELTQETYGHWIQIQADIIGMLKESGLAEMGDLAPRGDDLTAGLLKISNRF